MGGFTCSELPLAEKILPWVLNSLLPHPPTTPGRVFSFWKEGSSYPNESCCFLHHDLRVLGVQDTGALRLRGWGTKAKTGASLQQVGLGPRGTSTAGPGQELVASAAARHLHQASWTSESAAHGSAGAGEGQGRGRRGAQAAAERGTQVRCLRRASRNSFSHGGCFQRGQRLPHRS